MAVEVESRVAPGDTESRLFNIMPNIIDEIAQARHYFLYADKECNTVIIPESRRLEIEKEMQTLPFAYVEYKHNRKLSVFGCDVIFSYSIDKIKVGYTI